MIIPVAIICLLIAPANLSTAVLVGGTALMLMFIGRVKTRHIVLTIGLALIPVISLIVISNQRSARGIKCWKDAYLDKACTGFYVC